MDRQLLIFSGRSNPDFSSDICSTLNMDIGRLESIRFADGEVYVEIGDNVRGRDVFVCQSTSSPGNDHLMELLIIIDALKRASAWRITAVIPYFGYARQDRKLKSRVPITAKLVSDLITTAGADRVLTTDLHSGQIVGFFATPVDNLNALPVLLPYFKERYGDKEVTIVSPDHGGVERARDFATGFRDASIAIIDKRRAGPNQVSEMRIIGDVKDKICIIVDDMVDTGGTLIKAGETILAEGAKEVMAACVHPVMSGNAVERLEESVFSKIVVSDTIKQSGLKKSKKIKVLSMAPLFAEAIRRIHQEDSISSLFK